MIEAIVLSTLIFVSAALVLHGATLLFRHIIPVIRQYKIVRRDAA